MTIARFAFQRECVAMTTGRVLNVGCKEDPANLKSFGERVVNCDLEAVDSFLGTPNKADVLFDARETWPFEDDSAELVVLGDIIEHLYVEEVMAAFKEAHRVAELLCVTVPVDARGETKLEKPSGARNHVYVWDQAQLHMLLTTAGWHVDEWQTVDYTFVPEGFFIRCSRG